MASVSSSTQSTDYVLSNLKQSLAATSGSAESKTAKAQTDFLRLLTTQLKNQDPMNPVDNAEMTTQLAQINMVDGIERLNGTLQTLLDAQHASQAMQASNLVGRGVLVPGQGLTLTDSGAVGGFDLATAADQVLVSIRDGSGREVSRVELAAADAGSHRFVWDGSTSDGTQAAPGGYTIAVTASALGEKVQATALQAGVVSSVVRSASGADFEVGALGAFKFDDIKQIL